MVDGSNMKKKKKKTFSHCSMVNQNWVRVAMYILVVFMNKGMVLFMVLNI